MRSNMIILFILIASSAFAQPDTLWTTTFGDASGSWNEYGWSVKATSDGGFIIAGEGDALGAGEDDVYLIKTDEFGNEIWWHTYGGSNSDGAYNVVQTQDGGYALGGYTFSLGGAGNGNFYLVKTDAAGNEQWYGTYGQWYFYAIARCVRQAMDGGYILVGDHNWYMGWTYALHLARTDAVGTLLWEHSYDEYGFYEGQSVCETGDGDFVATGSVPAGNYRDVYLHKTDQSGNFQWNSTYGGAAWDAAYCIQPTPDGCYVIAGESTSFGSSSDFYLIKVDNLGNVIWSVTSAEPEGVYCYDMDQSPDGGYVVVGNIWHDNYDAYVVKFDRHGNQVWSKILYSAYNGYGIDRTLDGGYIVTGIVGGDIYLARLASEGQPLQVILTPASTPVQIPANGGTFDFNIAVNNTFTDSILCNVWTDVTLPNGTKTDPLIGPITIDVADGANLNRDRSQSVPANAPPGVYTYNAYVGTYPSEVWYSTHFEFEKLETGAGEAVAGWDNIGGSFDEEIVMPAAPLPDLLVQVSPNPFNPETVIGFELPVSGNVSLTIYDVSGRQVASLIDGYRGAGYQQVTFNGANLPSGVYFYRLKISGHKTSGKLILVK